VTKTSRITAENGSDIDQKIIFTAGKVFADGSALELIFPSTQKKPSLLLWADGQEPIVAREIDHDGSIYQPVNVDPSIWQATTLPTGFADRGPSANLFEETRDLFEHYGGLSQAEAALVTAWNATGWFADMLSNPPVLFMHGPDMGLAITLFRLLSCIGRHPLILTEIDRAALCSLMILQPTFLINQVQISPRFRALCCASNYRGVVVPGRDGGVLDVVSSKAIFVGNAVQASNDPGLHLFLRPASDDLPPLDVVTQRQMKERFEPWYLWHRLSNLGQMRRSRYASSDITAPMDELARMLQFCTRNGGQLEQQWAKLLRSQELDAMAERTWDPGSAMIEAIWEPLHSSEKSISMKDVSDLTNTLLELRGEIREYSVEELGKLLREMGVSRRRQSSGMTVIFDRETSTRVHQWARRFGVGNSVPNCADCTGAQIVAD
jgi:hypothetical protein